MNISSRDKEPLVPCRPGLSPSSLCLLPQDSAMLGTWDMPRKNSQSQFMHSLQEVIRKHL